MLLRKGFHQIKVKYGSNQLAKVGIKLELFVSSARLRRPRKSYSKAIISSGVD